MKLSCCPKNLNCCQAQFTFLAHVRISESTTVSVVRVAGSFDLDNCGNRLRCFVLDRYIRKCHKCERSLSWVLLTKHAFHYFQEEISYFKERINQQIAQANIRVYEPPEETFSIGEEGEKKDFQRMKV